MTDDAEGGTERDDHAAAKSDAQADQSEDGKSGTKRAKSESDGGKAQDGQSANGQSANGQSANGQSERDESREDGSADDAPEKPPLYKRPIFWIVVGVVAAILLVGGTLYYLHARKYVSTDDAFIDGHIVRISAQISGQLEVVAQDDNRHVRRGQVLAVIEPGTTTATRQSSLAGVAEADAGIEQARAQVAVAQAGLAQAIANTRVPLAEAQRASADYARYRTLKALDPLAAAPTQLDQARAQATAAAAQAAAAREQIATARANLGAMRRQVVAAQARRRAAEADVRRANVTSGYTVIRAPIDGQLVQRQVNVGSYVSPGQQMMAIVPDDLWVTANFKETQLTRMRSGQPVEIRIDAFPGEKFAGHVDSIQRGAGQAFELLPPQNATGNYVKVVQRVPVRIRFNDDSWRHFAVGPGMSVEPRVTIRQ